MSVILEKKIVSLQRLVDDLVNSGSKMAQELHDFIGDAEKTEGPENIEGVLLDTKEIIKEWEAVYKQTECHWQSSLAADSEPIFINNL